MPSPRRCPACHAAAVTGARWCGTCGAPLTTDVTDGPPRAAPLPQLAFLVVAIAVVVAVGGVVIGGGTRIAGPAGDDDPGRLRDEVALPAPDPGPEDATEAPETDPAAAMRPLVDLEVTCHVSPCERARITSTTGLGLDAAVLDGLLITSDGAQLLGSGPEGVAWRTTLMASAELPELTASGRQTSLVAIGGQVVVTTSDGRLLLADADGSIVSARDDPGPELELTNARVSAAALVPGRLLLALRSRLSPSLGQAEFADRSRTAAVVVAVDPRSLEVLERSDATPEARLIDGVPLISGRIEGDTALDPQDLGTVLWQAETRRPGTSPGELLGRLATIDDRGLELREPRSGETTLRLGGASWSIIEEGDLVVAAATGPDDEISRAYGIGPDGTVWQRQLIDPCCDRIVTGGPPDTVRLIADDGSSVVLDAASGAVRARQPAPVDARFLTGRDDLELLEGTEGLIVVGGDGTHLATIAGGAIVTDLPSSFARGDARTIAFRNAGTVVVLVFPR